jgi:hypothetical protein
MRLRGEKLTISHPGGLSSKRHSKAETNPLHPDHHDDLNDGNEEPQQERPDAYSDDDVDANLERTILEILRQRQPGKTC